MTAIQYGHISNMPKNLSMTAKLTAVIEKHVQDIVVLHPRINYIDVTFNEIISSITIHDGIIGLCIRSHNDCNTASTDIICNGARPKTLTIPYNIVHKFDISCVTSLAIICLPTSGNIIMDSLRHISKVRFIVTKEHANTIITEHFLQQCETLSQFSIVIHGGYIQHIIMYFIRRYNRRSILSMLSTNTNCLRIRDIFHDYLLDCIFINYNPMYRHIIQEFKSVYLSFGTDHIEQPDDYILNMRFNSSDSLSDYDLVFGAHTTYIRIVIRNFMEEQPTIHIFIPDTVVIMEFLMDHTKYNILSRSNGIPSNVVVLTL